MKLGRIVAMGAACALVLSTSACNSPGTAAVVAGQRISTSEVTSATQGFNRVTGRLAAERNQQASTAPEAAVLSMMMRAKAAEALAGPDAPALLGSAELLMKDPDWANPAYLDDAQARQFVKAIAISQTQGQAMGEERFEESLQGVPVTINPRYGLSDLKPLTRNPATGEAMTRSSSLSNVG